ncbi:hypothetical protein MKW98_010632 [Papaver atlanticum]|uniref:Uncharacterized protein n=1 Tax=Papaver atlanticum TaxID=357466 RepID=A0AAD4S493_9MAGN|nr:hypothetical protein MKW98_010632 [Papaver atlanticum]
MVNDGNMILGNSEDQWSDLLEEIIRDEGPPKSDGNVTKNGSRLSSRDSNGPLTNNQKSQNPVILAERISGIPPVNVSHGFGDTSLRGVPYGMKHGRPEVGYLGNQKSVILLMVMDWIRPSSDAIWC